MTTDRIAAEREAAQSLLTLLEQADQSKILHERAGMALPEPLKRILGMNGNLAKPPQRIVVPPPERKSRPPAAGGDWVSIDIKHATPTSVALAILRTEKTAVRAKDVVNQVVALLPDVSSGSIANIGSRLSGTLIQRAEDGWTLIKPDAAPVLHDGRLWGPPSVFSKTELASHRREGILQVLKFFHGGLQTLQILEQLRACAWIQAPLSKDLLKVDLEVLAQEKKIRRRGNTKKWELAPDTEEG